MFPRKGTRVLPFFCGLAIWLALPPFEAWPLAWFSLAPVLILIRGSSRLSNAFAVAFFTAFVPIAGIAYSLIPFSLPFYFFILLLLPVSFGLLGVLYKVIADRLGTLIGRVLIVPVLWTLFEVAFTESPASLPIQYAITQASRPTLIQLASFGGIYLVSFLILLVNAFLAEAFILSKLRSERRSVLAVSSAVSIFLFNLLFGFYNLSRPLPAAKSLAISSVQPVISSEDYRDHWIDPAVRKRVSKIFSELTEQAVSGRSADLLLWPEGGNGYYNFRIPAFREALFSLASRSNASLLISSLDLDPEGNKFNSVFSVGPNLLLIDKYDKIKLTPIGEETFKAGQSLRPLSTPVGKVGVLVCYESAFSSLARRVSNQGADFLFITTSDAPFRNSAFPLLHASMAPFRAVENGITVVRSANTGPSVVVDPYGRVLARSDFYVRGILKTQMAVPRIETWYSRYGNSWMILPALFFCWVLFRLFLQRVRFGTFRSRGVIRRPSLLTVAATVTILLILSLLPPLVSLTFIAKRRMSVDLRDGFETFLHVKKPPTSWERLLEFSQRGTRECGPASLAYVLNFFGLEIDQIRIIKNVEMTQDGTSMAELARFTRQAGLEAWGERQNGRRLREVTKPVIAFIRRDHFVVVLNADPRGVTYFDPAAPEGLRRLTWNDFTKTWRGEVLRILPKPL